MARRYFSGGFAGGGGRRDVRRPAERGRSATERLIRGQAAASLPHRRLPRRGIGPFRIDSTTASGCRSIDGTQLFHKRLPKLVASRSPYVRTAGSRSSLGLRPDGDELFAARRGRPATLNGRPLTSRLAAAPDAGMSGRLSPRGERRGSCR